MAEMGGQCGASQSRSANESEEEMTLCTGEEFWVPNDMVGESTLLPLRSAQVSKSD